MDNRLSWNEHHTDAGPLSESFFYISNSITQPPNSAPLIIA